MKGLSGLFLVGVVGIAGAYFVMNKMTEDQGATFALAFGNPTKDSNEFHLAIPPGLQASPPPKVDPKSGFVFWDEWLDDHFRLVSADGEKVKIDRLSWSTVISDKQAKAAPEFFLKMVVKPGIKYYFDYIPLKDGKTHDRYTFTAPAEAVKMVRENFPPVTK